MSAPKILTPPIPSLAEWLGDGARADGFEAWVAESLGPLPADLPPDAAAAARVIQTLAIAFVEAGRLEMERHGRAYTETLATLARAAGFTVACAVLSPLRADLTPKELYDVAASLRREFRHGVQLAIDGAGGEGRP